MADDLKDHPWFPFYYNDFWMDDNVQAMTNAQVGAYIRLLTICWRTGGIPDSVVALGEICKFDAAEMSKSWPRIAPCFKEHPTDAGRLFNVRMEEERQRALALKEKASRKGKDAAERRWGNARGNAQGNATGMPVASHGHVAGNARSMPGDAQSHPQSEPAPPPGGGGGARSAPQTRARAQEPAGAGPSSPVRTPPEKGPGQKELRDTVIALRRFAGLHPKPEQLADLALTASNSIDEFLAGAGSAGAVLAQDLRLYDESMAAIALRLKAKVKPPLVLPSPETLAWLRRKAVTR